MLEKRISRDCDELGSDLITAYGQLASAQVAARQGFRGNAEKFIRTALAFLEYTKIDKEDLESITKPLVEMLKFKGEL